MEKKNTILLTIIALATLLISVVGATFAYFASNVNTKNGDVNVNVNTSKNQASFISTSDGDININVDSYMMQESNAGDGNNTSKVEEIANNLVATANININLTASEAGNISECSYDLIYEWDTTSSDFTQVQDNGSDVETAKGKASNKSIYPSKYYIRTQSDTFTEEFKEFTIAAHQIVSGAETGEEYPSTGDLFNEKNIDEFECVGAAKENAGDCSKLYLKKGETLATTSTATVNYQFTIKFYNLPSDQSTLMGKNFKGHIIVDNVVC